MTRGRKPDPAAEDATVRVNETALAEARQAADTLASLKSAVAAGQVAFSQRVGELIGRQRAADAITKLLTVSTLMDIAHIKESKEYKDLQVLDPDGKLLTVSTWDQFCEAVVGRSRQQVDEDLLNLKSFGAAFLESVRPMGLGYRELREMRSLPADQRTELLAAAQAGDKETLIEVAEGLIEKHARERKEIEGRLAKVVQAAEAKDKLIAKKNQKLDELLEREELRTSGSLEQREQLQMDDLRGVALGCDEAVARALRAIDATMAAPASEACDLAARQTLDYITQRFVLAAQSLGMALMVDGEEVIPAWRAADIAVAEQGLAAMAARKAARGAAVNDAPDAQG